MLRLRKSKEWLSNLFKVRMMASGFFYSTPNPWGLSNNLQVGLYSLGTADPVNMLAQGEQEFLAMS